MKICIAQIRSLKGNIPKNIQNHLDIVGQAIQLGADLIVFPELSITNYEPRLVQKLAVTAGNAIFNPFQVVADKNEISIGIGVPLSSSDGITISMLIFQPHQQQVAYSKQMLDIDEFPYFICGNNQKYLNIEGKEIAMGICYETLQRTHFVNAKQHGADIYIASVAKPTKGLAKAYQYFPAISKEFNTPILMANCVGPCDNFLSMGKSAIWNSQGQLVKSLNTESQSLMIYDTVAETIVIEQVSYSH